MFTLTIDRGEAEVNSQGRGDNKLAIPEYTVYKYFTIPKNIVLYIIAKIDFHDSSQSMSTSQLIFFYIYHPVLFKIAVQIQVHKQTVLQATYVHNLKYISAIVQYKTFHLYLKVTTK
jgi:hypothetical protein